MKHDEESGASLLHSAGLGVFWRWKKRVCFPAEKGCIPRGKKVECNGKKKIRKCLREDQMGMG